MEKYILLLWPYSQSFVGHPKCFFYHGNLNGGFPDELFDAVFVSESVLSSESPEQINKVGNGMAGKYVAYSYIVAQSLGEGHIGCSYVNDEDWLVFIESCDEK